MKTYSISYSGNALNSWFAMAIVDDLPIIVWLKA